MKVLSIIMAIVLIAGSLFVLPLSAEAVVVQTRTVMLYVVGSDLESDYGCATYNLVQSMESEYNENLNFIVMTGGSTGWNTEEEYLSGAEEVDSAYNQIWKLEGKRGGEEHGRMVLLESTGIEGYEQTLMSDPQVLTAFADYCYTNYPADQYDLILWDHGGGPASGFGCDNRIPNGNIMSLSQMMSAFSATKLIEDNKKFEIIDFDACLMASAEITEALEKYADYLVVSPELEPGDGQEYTAWLNALKNNPSMNGYDLGKAIVDATMDYYTEGAGKGDDATLSVIDTKNYMERVYPWLCVLDEILIGEAKSVGRRNNRYNFYDEFYSLKKLYAYDAGGGSLVDLGNLAGALSVPQTELKYHTGTAQSSGEPLYRRRCRDTESSERQRRQR